MVPYMKSDQIYVSRSKVLGLWTKVGRVKPSEGKIPDLLHELEKTFIECRSYLIVYLFGIIIRIVEVGESRS